MPPEDKSENVERTAAANTTAQAKRAYGRGRAADRALKSAVGGRGRRAAAAPAVPGAAPMTAAQRRAAAKQAEGNEANAADLEPPKGVDHSYGALDTTPPGAEAASKANAPAPRGRKGKKARRTK